MLTHFEGGWREIILMLFSNLMVVGAIAEYSAQWADISEVRATGNLQKMLPSISLHE
jgi:hypothetical protein